MYIYLATTKLINFPLWRLAFPCLISLSLKRDFSDTINFYEFYVLLPTVNSCWLTWGTLQPITLLLTWNKFFIDCNLCSAIIMGRGHSVPIY